MSPDHVEDPAADMEMTTHEAVAYLSGPVGFPLSTTLMYLLRSLRIGPVAEKRGARLVYRKSAWTRSCARTAPTSGPGPTACGGTLPTSFASCPRTDPTSSSGRSSKPATAGTTTTGIWTRPNRARSHEAHSPDCELSGYPFRPRIVGGIQVETTRV